MKNSKTTAESSKATAPKSAEAKGTKEKLTSASEAKKVKVKKDDSVKHSKP
ncbi:hypothetical protein [Pedobacter jejuensis]|uniref:hypothetical protein n=1 Tax=Pedobacter jejuensis TaxID=1268550 RepID=UPI00142D9925|nr:hypothetical protein [Pedobacter jejuensis]